LRVPDLVETVVLVDAAEEGSKARNAALSRFGLRRLESRSPAAG
jgi:hypothetical protein